MVVFIRLSSVCLFALFFSILPQNCTSLDPPLKAVYVSTKLPNVLHEHSAIYDGDDAIFIFGGYEKTTAKLDILKYTISTEEIVKVQTLPQRGIGGTVHADKDGNFLYIGGGDQAEFVFSFNPKTNGIGTVGVLLPPAITYRASVKYNDSSVVIIGQEGGANCSNILQLDMDDFNLLSLEEILESPYCSYSAVRRDNSEEVFLFGRNSPVIKLDLRTFQSQIVSANFLNLTGIPATVSDGKYAYLIGGYESWPSTPSNGIFQFDMGTLTFQFMPVEDFPVTEKERFHNGPATVYVEKFNRFYFFGGLSSMGFYYRDEIWYIDLPNLSATETPTTPDDGIDDENDDSAKTLSENELIIYVIIGITSLIIILMIVYLLRRRCKPPTPIKPSTRRKEPHSQPARNPNPQPVAEVPPLPENAQTVQPRRTSGSMQVFKTAHPGRIAKQRRRSSGAGSIPRSIPTGSGRPQGRHETRRQSLTGVVQGGISRIPLGHVILPENMEYVGSLGGNALFSVQPQGSRTYHRPSFSNQNPVWKSKQPLKLTSEIPIGSGAFSYVYKAQHSLLGFVAIKKINLYKASVRMKTISNVFKEMENLCRIGHPNVVKLYQCWIEDPFGRIVSENAKEKFPKGATNPFSSTQEYYAFIQMELCDGDLDNWLKHRQTLYERKVLVNQNKDMFKQIISGLQAIHKMGIIHRDLKPKNIFYSGNPNVWKIGDLGLSTEVKGKTAIGTVSYRSPEMELGTYDKDFKVDVFSLGLTFLEIIHVFRSDEEKMEASETLRKVRSGIHDPLGFLEIDRHVDPEIRELVSKMVVADPSKRINLFDRKVEMFLTGMFILNSSYL